MSESSTEGPRRKHLMDPNQPRRSADPEAVARLERVQRRVLSALVFTTLIHLAVGLVIAAAAIDDDRLDAQIGLNVLAAAFGVLSVASLLAINRRPWLSPWLLAGVLPGVVGMWIVLR